MHTQLTILISFGISGNHKMTNNYILHFSLSPPPLPRNPSIKLSGNKINLGNLSFQHMVQTGMTTPYTAFAQQNGAGGPDHGPSPLKQAQQAALNDMKGPPSLVDNCHSPNAGNGGGGAPPPPNGVTVASIQAAQVAAVQQAAAAQAQAAAVAAAAQQQVAAAQAAAANGVESKGIVFYQTKISECALFRSPAFFEAKYN